MASPFLYGCHYAWMLSIFTVVMVYGVACPLIMPIGLCLILYFVVMVYRFVLCFVL